MFQVSRSELEEAALACDALVERDRAIDPFCSRTAWQLAYHDAFAPQRPLWFARDGDDFVMLAERQHPKWGNYYASAVFTKMIRASGTCSRTTVKGIKVALVDAKAFLDWHLPLAKHEGWPFWGFPRKKR